MRSTDVPILTEPVNHQREVGVSISTVRFIFLSLTVLSLMVLVPSVSGQSNGLITQTVIVQTINYKTNLPFSASITVTYTCSNPDGTYTPYSVQGWVNPPVGIFSLTCKSPSTFNSWIHVYAQNGNWWGTTDYRWVPSQGGRPVTLTIALVWTPPFA